MRSSRIPSARGAGCSITVIGSKKFSPKDARDKPIHIALFLLIVLDETTSSLGCVSLY
jgi:hypothetical protein